MSDQKPLLIISSHAGGYGKWPRIPYDLRFYDDKVEYVGIAIDKLVNTLITIYYLDIKSVDYKKDWNSFWLKYGLLITMKDGKTKKLAGHGGMSLEEATNAKRVITSHL